jgi:asparagine synthase (glutamine-hydrolysing)
MSGIFTILHRDRQPVDRELLQQMTDSLQYLGPDRQEIWLGGCVGLGHTLFRTTDESQNERQPCTLDGKVYITADARIDARDELIPRLQAKGCEVSHDAPDVELILHAYQMWGEGCLQNLLGDFAFILWDRNRQRLFCARDRFGMRRLYYAQVGSALVLCNSLDCLRRYPGVTAKLNEQAVGDFLLFGNHMWLDKSITIFADIQKVPPAHCLIWESQNLEVKRYWDIPLEVPLLRYKKEADYIAHFREIFTTAVRDRMRADKIVISMSGGMDSSSIAATACRIAREKSNPPQIQAFTAVYDRIHPDQERYYAGLVAEKLGLPIHYFVCDNYQLLAPAVRTPEPIEVYAPTLHMDLGRQLAALGRVVLTGNSGDNLLYCSPVKLALKEMNPVSLLWQMLRLWQHFGKTPSLGTGLITKLTKKDYKDSREPSYPYPCWLNPEFETRLQLKNRWRSLWYSEPPVLHPRHPEIQKLLLSPDWSWSLEYLSDIDFNPAEYRDPFLDVRLLEFVLSLPLLPWLFKKYLLRQTMGDVLPPEVCQRPKTPLGMIHQCLLEQPGTEWVDSWKALPDLLSYVNYPAIPPIAQGVADPTDSYVHLRPLILNLWLQGI